jgi:predicted RecA/RadA family phage recombinase
MANLFTYLSAGDVLDHTPGTALTGGQVIQLAGKMAAIPSQPIAASVLGSVAINGRFSGPYVGNACNVGDNLWWDASGTPYGGSADGALTNLGADGDWWVGTVTAAAAANDASIEFALNLENPTQPNWVGRTFLKTAVDLTMVEATHSGMVIEVTADAKTITLPTGVVGMEYIVVNRVVDAGSLTTVDLDGNEIIRGANLTIAATKKALNTKVTSVQGDYLHLICTVAATAWRCVGKRGTWVTD